MDGDTSECGGAGEEHGRCGGRGRCGWWEALGGDAPDGVQAGAVWGCRSGRAMATAALRGRAEAAPVTGEGAPTGRRAD